ncbi:DUF4097 family beta strand repeat-containing protein [Pendulispora albinea]|uniref:DUF4097 domain-containing protein n=1 Tax=Pendulispora albinea TaxID=2741071 RepID=A0ABZ2M3T1_9BACT
MRTKLSIVLALASLACASLAAPVAQARPDEPLDTRPAATHGVVTIETISGSVKVIGWGRSEVDVKSSADGDTQFSVQGDRTQIRARSATLEVRVPAASALEVRGTNIDITIRDVTGAVRVDTASGDIAVSGAPTSISARTASGSVSIDTTSAQTTVRTINGDIRVRGARGTASIESVSGECTLSGGTFQHVDMRSTSGDLTFDGQLAGQGSFDVRSHSGDVSFLVPASTNGNFELRSFRGSISSQLGGVRTGNGSLEFKAGSGGAVVRVQTFSGDIHIAPRGASSPAPPPAPPAPPAPPKPPSPPQPQPQPNQPGK